MQQSHLGATFALVAMTIWGIAPVYFVLVGFASPMEILSHRIFLVGSAVMFDHKLSGAMG